ncbi:cytochrome P450 [Nemania abortiva]|nr:cytochrome P450 [Nemania abortiva]
MQSHGPANQPSWQICDWGRFENRGLKLDWQGLCLLLITGSLVYQFMLGVYRLYFHSLARFPGPKLAAFSYWYEAYYNALLGGKYFRVIDELHRRYGHAVRINPDEVHFDDPESIELLFPTGGRRTNKPWEIQKRTGTPDSLVATVDHDTHRRRRNAISPFFSTARIRALDPIMQEHMAKLLVRMEHAARRRVIIRMHPLIKACTSDIINIYAFGDSFHFLDREDLGQPYYQATDVFFALTHWFGHFTWFADLVHSLPFGLVALLAPPMEEMYRKKTAWVSQLQHFRKSPDSDNIKSTIFEGVLRGTLPSEDKSDWRLVNEAQLVVFAGEGTTAYTLTAAIYEILAHPTVAQKLRDELVQALPDPEAIPYFAQVDSLPYLNAVIQEAVRIHPGVMGRQVRISPDVDIVYRDKSSGVEHILPRGMRSSMSPLSTHMNAEVFKNPYEFEPQRWIDNPSLGWAFHGFSRGSRNCVAMNFARKEMAVFLATIFRKYDLYCGQEGKTLELYDTERSRDIDPTSDFIIPVPAEGSKGLRVRIRN